MVTTVERTRGEYRRPRRGIPILMALIILISGTVIGAGGTMGLMRHRFIRVQQATRSSTMASAVALRMRHEYDLTDQQAESVERVIRTRLAEAAAAHRQFLLRVGATREGFMADMKELLPPETYGRLGRRFETRERRFRWFFGLPQQPHDDSLDASVTPPGQE